MSNRLPLLLFLALALSSSNLARAGADCSYDRQKLMALDEHTFDQDLAGGWRTLGNISDCQEVAADVIRDYRESHHLTSGILYWHEGQLRAMANHYEQAVPLLEKSREPAMRDPAWNLYVDATIAFLNKDLAALEKARTTLAALQPSGDVRVRNGYLEINGEQSKIPWPVNLDVVDGLRKCFWKSYSEAYGGAACRNSGH